MKDRARRINVDLIDHLIISQGGYYSFLHQKLIHD